MLRPMKPIFLTGLALLLSPTSTTTAQENHEHSVSVHVDGIMKALVKIYDAHRVANELTGK